MDDTLPMLGFPGARLARLASRLRTHLRLHPPARPARRGSARRPGRSRLGGLDVEPLERRALLTTYSVGPGQAYTDLASVPWTNLGPGDVVAIHWQPEPYREKLLISASGTANAPIEIVGVPGPDGQKPVIDGQNATTSSQFHYTYDPLQEASLLLIARNADQDYNYKPAYINIEGLEFRNAYSTNSFTDSHGTSQSYNPFSASIYIAGANNVTIRNDTLDNSGLGLFILSNIDEAHTTRNVLVEGNSIYGNGVPGSYLEHNVYSEAAGITYQYNDFGPLRPGANGNNVKDRSAGAVFAYNTFAPGAHMLDLVDPEDDAPILTADPRFATTYVYGNVFDNTGPNASTLLIHFGGDSGNSSIYRPHLEFYDNTLVNVADQLGASGRWRTIVFQMDSNDQSASVFNNIFDNAPATAGSSPSFLEFMHSSGAINFGPNWVSPGWLPSYDGLDFNGSLSGTANLVVDPNNDPHFVDPAAGDFHLAAGSSALGLGIAVPATDPAVDSEYVAPQSSQPRASTADLGAFPFQVSPPAALAVTATTPAPGSTGASPRTPLTASFNEAIDPSTLAFTLTGPDGQPVPALVLYNDIRHTATLLPSTALGTGTTYTATLSGAQDRAGVPLAAPVSWSFTTDAPPVVTGVSPTGAVGMYDGVSVTFNVPVDPASLVLGFVGPNGWTVSSTPIYDASTRTVRFVPGTGLAAGQSYTAVLSSAADLQGTPIAAPLTWSFTVSPVFDGSDRTTQGNWKGSYGTEGFDLPGDPSPSNPALPSYVASVTPTGATVSEFATGTTDPRALRQAAVASAARTSGYWSSATSLSFDVAVTDAAAHAIALYAVDFDNQGRSEQVDLVSDATGQVLDTRTLTDFQNGVYLTWSVSGSVTIRVTNLSSRSDAVVGGLFFGAGPPPPPATASFVGLVASNPVSASTYGTDGFVLAGDPNPGGTDLPSYVASVTPTGAQDFVWSNSVTAPSASPLAASGLAGGFGTAWSSPTGFSFDLEMNDSTVHRVLLYAVDFDNENRSERIDLIDDLTGQVLDTRTLSSFQAGASLSWDIRGSVTVRMTNLNPTGTAILNAVFFGGALPTSATASFAGADGATQGNWKGVYGSDGADLVDSSSAGSPSLPPYVASLTVSGAVPWAWTDSSSDPRALQQAANGPTSRLTAGWFAATSFSIDVHMADAATHRLVLYALDFDSGNRSETISLIDDATGQVLDTRSLSNFQNGDYLAWDVRRSVTVLVTNTSTNSNSNAVVNGLFLGGALPAPATASFTGVDGATQGNWKGVYGTDGFDLVDDPSASNPSIPSYVTSITVSGAVPWAWTDSSSDPRALEQAVAGSTSRVAAGGFSSTSFSIDVHMADHATHRLVLYAVDFDSGNRSETISLIDDVTGQVLDTRSLSNFQNGVYLAWDVTGSVTIRVTNTNPNCNALLNGIFFGDDFPTPATASFAGSDTTTQGNWKGVYGSDGSDLVDDPSAGNPSLPAYVTSLTVAGAVSWAWTDSSNDPRALQQAAAGSTDRVAAGWFAATSFSIDVHMADAATHRIVLYALDFDSGNRSERIDLVDDLTGQVLDTRNLSNFQDGIYLAWDVTGSVTVRVTNTSTNPNSNAVVNGLFFGGALPTPATASFAGADTATQGDWKGDYGADGFDLVDDPSASNPSLPAYVASLTVSGAVPWAWTDSSNDPRALEQAAAGSTDRVAAGWFAATSFSIDIRMADTASHRLALYALDFDSGNRSERIDLVDDLTGQVLDSRTLSAFQNGAYLAWNVSGNVTVRVTNTSTDPGSNAIVNGLFFG